MKKLPPLSLKVFAISAFIGMPLAHSFAGQEDQHNEGSHVIKHKVIEIKTHNNEPTTLEIDNNGVVKVIQLQPDDISNITVLEDRLSSLDKETRKMVLKLLQNRESLQKDTNAHNTHLAGEIRSLEAFHIRNAEEQHKKMIIELENMSEAQHLSSDKQVFIINGGEGLHFDGVLKGHHKGIIKLIAKGEFTRDELNAIQKALDAKF
jgi:uncharacterized protein YggL (DUF469 family)